MLKFRILAALLIAYVFAMGFVFSSSEQAPPNVNKQPTKTENGNRPQGTTITDHRTSHNSEKRDDKRQWYDTFRERPTDWLLVLFNGLLVVATIALFISGEKSANAAKAAAEAAKLSAQAAIGVELPRLFVTKIDIELAALNTVDPEASLQKISAIITNYGRTPAVWFRDFLNESHLMRFCADLHVPQGLAAGHPPKFIQGGPTTYTESY